MQQQRDAMHSRRVIIRGTNNEGTGRRKEVVKVLQWERLSGDESRQEERRKEETKEKEKMRREDREINRGIKEEIRLNCL